MFRFYFLALLLICALPVFAQEASASEGTSEQSEAAAPAQEAPAEAAQQQDEKATDDVKANAEKAQEELEAETADQKEEAEPAKEEAPAKEAGSEKEEGQSDLEAELAAQAENIDAAQAEKSDAAQAEKSDAAGEKAEEKKQPTFTIGINNSLSHGFAKERKSFGYTLNVFASYSFPLEFALSADLGLRESYRYGMSEAVATEAGMESSSDLDYSKFDGTPLNVNLSKGFEIGGGVNGSIGIGASIPCTSKELWDVYGIRTILGVDLGLAKNFTLQKEVILGLSFGFSYAKTFAEYDAAWDKYSNEPLGYLQNHDIGLSLALGIIYKGFGFKLSGGYNFGSDFKLNSWKSYDDWSKEGTISDSSWYYLFSFGATASYSIKGFVFALGVRTNAPEFDNGNYEGFKELPGDPDVKNGSTNYPFKAKYTTVFANIGYSYSF